MAKSLLRLEARKLRKRGISVRTIAQTLQVSKNSASLWTRDIILSVEQLEALRQASIKGAELGRLKSSLMQKEKRLKFIEDFRIEGVGALSNLKEREFFGVQ